MSKAYLCQTWKENDESCYDCLQNKTRCDVLNVPFRDQKPTIMLSGGDGRFCLVNRLSRDYDNRKSFRFLENFLRQSQSSTHKPVTIKAKNFNLWHNRLDSHWLIQLTIKTFAFSFFTLSFYSKRT